MNRHCLLPLSFCVAIVFVSVGPADDWKQWRGPQQNGHASQQGYFDKSGFRLSLVWKKRIGSGYSGIAVADGKLLVPYGDGKEDWLGAFDAKTGKPIWKHRLGTMYPAHDGGHDGPLSSPVADGKHVYMLAPRGTLHAVRLQDGRPIWQVNLVEHFGARNPFWGFCTSPALADEFVIVQVSGQRGNGIVAFRKKDGTVGWKQPCGQVDYRSPVVSRINENPVLIGCSRNETCGISPASGDKLWSQRFSSVIEMTPVPVGGNQILMTKRSGVDLYRVSPEGSVSFRWSSNEFRGNYGTPVHFAGHVYGFSNHVLTCVDVKNGRRIWRSRGPGGGKGLILVDGHLVMLGAKGDVVVAQASADRYLERARLHVSSADGYAAPIFADGLIFVRDLSGHVFAVRAESAKKPVVNKTVKPANQFEAFLAKLKQSDNHRETIDQFLKAQRSFPIVEDNRWVHFVYRGSAEDVAISGSMIASGEEDALTRVAETDLFYRSYPIDPGSRWEYRFIVDFDKRIRDPRNPRVAYGNSRLSELVTKGWTEPNWTAEYKGQRRGSFKTVVYAGGMANVYLPHGYANSDLKYPVIVVTDGPNWISTGKLRDILDQVFDGKVAPSIVAFVSGSGGRELGGANTAGFAKRLANELIKTLDSQFRTKQDRSARTLVGRRGAAVAAVYTVLRYPDVFGNCIAISYGRADTVRKNAIGELIEKFDGSKPKFHIAWNRYEVSRPQSFHCRDQSREINQQLKDAGFPLSGGERNDSANWRSWRILAGQAIIESGSKK